jgi:hypothetical protein
MEFGKNRFLMLDNHSIEYKKFIVGGLALLLLAAIGKLWFDANSLEAKLLTANRNIETLTNQLASSQDNLKAQAEEFKRQTELLKSDGDSRTAAFAKQAAKCVPLMQKLDVKN